MENNKEQYSFAEEKEAFESLVSEQEIAAEGKEAESEKSKKDSKIKKILFQGWKKDLKKAWFLIKILIHLAAILWIVGFIRGNLFGWKFDLNLSRVNYKFYNHIGPDFSFQYPDYFNIDSGEGKNYGENYLTGFKLKTDQRTGCDVRLNKVGINFKKNDEEIKNALVNEISKTAKDFNLSGAKRIKIGGKDAFSLEFTFTDPLGSMLRLKQVMTSDKDNNNYLIICGTGDYQYKFFQRDFNDFLKSYKWKSNIAK